MARGGQGLALAPSQCSFVVVPESLVVLQLAPRRSPPHLPEVQMPPARLLPYLATQLPT